MARAIEQVKLDNLMVICCNGAQVLDSHTKTIVKAFSIPADHVREIAAIIKAKLGDEAFLGAECGSEFKCELGYAVKRGPDAMNHPHTIIQDPAEFGTVEKIIVVHKSWPADQLTDYLMSEVFTDEKWRHSITPTFSSLHFVEISAANVNKATGLQHLCEKLDIPREQVIAFGDMPNDLEMIRYAGKCAAALMGCVGCGKRKDRGC